MLGSTPSGLSDVCWQLLRGVFRVPPLVRCGLPYHISSLTLWESAGNCSGGFRGPPRSGVAFPTTSRLDCLEVYWQLLRRFLRSPLGRVWPSLPHLVSNPLGVCWQLLRGFSELPPRSGVVFPTTSRPLTLWESVGNCSVTQTQLS